MPDQMGYAETVTVRSASKATLIELRVIVETVQTRSGSSLHAADSLQAHVNGAGITDVVTVKSATKALALEFVAVGVSNLVEAIRLKAKATLPELAIIVESMTDALVFLSSQSAPLLTFLVIDMQEDQDVSDTQAVYSEGFKYAANLYYIIRSPRDSTTDIIQRVRPRLELLQQAFLADRKMGGITVNVDIPQTPIRRANEYETFFTAQGQDVAVMTIQCSFLVVNDYSRLPRVS